jgi:hypothetical protein
MEGGSGRERDVNLNSRRKSTANWQQSNLATTKSFPFCSPSHIFPIVNFFSFHFFVKGASQWSSCLLLMLDKGWGSFWWMACPCFCQSSQGGLNSLDMILHRVGIQQSVWKKKNVPIINTMVVSTWKIPDKIDLTAVGIQESSFKNPSVDLVLKTSRMWWSLSLLQPSILSVNLFYFGFYLRWGIDKSAIVHVRNCTYIPRRLL